MEFSNEDEPDLMDNLLQKHRKEKKELQAKCQALKKTASKGDKKRKKEVIDEINTLEQNLKKQHEEEISQLKSQIDTNQSIDDLKEVCTNGVSRITKAQKRRNKKLLQEKEREMRSLEQAVLNLQGPRHLETEEIKRILKERGLMISEVASDGDCLYNAIIKRIKELDGINSNISTVVELRHQTADFLRKNREEYLPYLSHHDTGDTLTNSQYEEYCDQVKDKAWGGQVELRVLSHILKRPLEVIQSTGPPVVVGDEYQKKGNPNVTLTYHRFMYGLGEHYNSTTAYKEINSDLEETEDF